MKIFYAKSLQDELTKKLKRLYDKVKDVRPKVALVYNDDSSESILYTNVQKKKLGSFGIECVKMPFLNSTREWNLIRKIKLLNRDRSFTGISINFPLPKRVSRLKVFEAIDVKKDVEGLNPRNVGLVFYKDSVVLPSVVMACYYLMFQFYKSLKGLEICIVNDSTLIGKPLSMLLLNRAEEAPTVSILNKYTRDIARYTSRADILVTAVGMPGLIKAKHAKKGSIIIDAGINVVDGKVLGDVDINSVKNRVKAVTAVPGGVGVVSQNMFVANVLKLCHLKKFRSLPRFL